jgi:hypothetical protein
LTRFFNWAMPSSGVAVEQLRPDTEYVQIVLAESPLHMMTFDYVNASSITG